MTENEKAFLNALEGSAREDIASIMENESQENKDWFVAKVSRAIMKAHIQIIRGRYIKEDSGKEMAEEDIEEEVNKSMIDLGLRKPTE